MSVGGNLRASSDVSVGGVLAVDAGGTVSGDLQVGGAAHFGHAVTVTGSISGWGPYLDSSDRRFKEGE